MSSREKRPFWYFLLTLGAGLIAVAVLAPSGLIRDYEFIGGVVIFAFSFVRLIFLKGRRAKRRRRPIKKRASAESSPPAT